MDEIIQCYKLHFDVMNSDLTKFFDKLQDIGDSILVNNSVYVWLNDNCDKTGILSCFKKAKIKEYVCIPVKQKDVFGRNDFIEGWFNEHYSNYESRRLEEEHQEELQKMLDNIKRADKLLDEMIEKEKNKQQEVADNG